MRFQLYGNTPAYYCESGECNGLNPTFEPELLQHIQKYHMDHFMEER